MTSEMSRTVSKVREAFVDLENAASAATVTVKEMLKFIPASGKDGTGQVIGGSPKKSDTARLIDPSRPVLNRVKIWRRRMQDRC